METREKQGELEKKILINTVFDFLRFKMKRLPHTLGTVVTLQVYMLVGCGGQRPGFKSSGGIFTHIYT